MNTLSASTPGIGTVIAAAVRAKNTFGFRCWTFVAALLYLAGCGGGSGGATSGNDGINTGGSGGKAVLVSITATPANPSLAVGTQVTLTITGNLSDGTTTTSVAPPFFSSSAPTVAPVDQAGNVSALAVGSATITVTVNAITTTTTVTVTAGLASLVPVLVWIGAV